MPVSLAAARTGSSFCCAASGGAAAAPPASSPAPGESDNSACSLSFAFVAPWSSSHPVLLGPARGSRAGAAHNSRGALAVPARPLPASASCCSSSGGSPIARAPSLEPFEVARSARRSSAPPDPNRTGFRSAGAAARRTRSCPRATAGTAAGTSPRSAAWRRQRQAAALHRRAPDGMLEHAPCRLGALLAHERPPRPAHLVHDSRERLSVARVQLGHPGIVALEQRSVTRAARPEVARRPAAISTSRRRTLSLSLVARHSSLVTRPARPVPRLQHCHQLRLDGTRRDSRARTPTPRAAGGSSARSRSARWSAARTACRGRAPG